MAVKPQILVVDDEEDSRVALETLLGTWGYATDVASQGREALEKAPSLRPSLVITDLMMPDMDGLTRPSIRRWAPCGRAPTTT